MAIKNEIETLKSVISPLIPNAKFALQMAVKVPTTSNVQIEALGQIGGNTETHFTYANERTFRIVIYGSSGLDVITKADAVGDALANNMKIQISTEPGYMTLGSFNLSETFETSTAGIFAIIGMLSATVRKARTQTEYEKIMKVGVSAYSDEMAKSWGFIDGTNTPTIGTDGFTWEEIEQGKTLIE